MTDQKHFKIFDGGGLIQAILVQNKDNVNIVKPDATVEIVGTIDDVKSKIGGDYVEIEAEEYNAIFTTWKEKSDANAANSNAAEDPAAKTDPGTGGTDAGSQGSAANDSNGSSEQASGVGSDVSGDPATTGQDVNSDAGEGTKTEAAA